MGYISLSSPAQQAVKLLTVSYSVHFEDHEALKIGSYLRASRHRTTYF